MFHHIQKFRPSLEMSNGAVVSVREVELLPILHLAHGHGTVYPLLAKLAAQGIDRVQVVPELWACGLHGGKICTRGDEKVCYAFIHFEGFLLCDYCAPLMWYIATIANKNATH